jgi:hypothetical protein
MAQRRFSRSRTGLRWGLVWAIATVVCLIIFARPVETPVDEDEIYWLGSTYYFHLAFVVRDWRHPDWALLPALENPPVAKYVLGLGLAGGDQAVESLDFLGTFYLFYEKVPGAWGTPLERTKREAVVNRMSPELRTRIRAGAQPQVDLVTLAPARRVVLGCAILTSLILLILGWQVNGPLCGLLASQLYLLHPAVVHAYNHAHSDIIAWLFATAAATVTYFFVCRATATAPPAWGIQSATAVGIGTLLGLACGAKMNALIVTGFAGVALCFTAVAAWRLGGTRGRQTTFSVLVAFVVAVVVFIGLNPAILCDLRAGLLATVREHQLTEQIQAGFLSGHLVSWSEKVATVAHIVVFSWLGFAVLTLAAIVSSVKKSLGSRFVALWYWMGLGCVTLWIPFDRGRYAVPVILPAVMLVAISLAALIELFMVHLHRRACIPAAEQSIGDTTQGTG